MFGITKDIHCVEAQKVKDISVSELRNAIGGCPDGCGKLEIFTINGVTVVAIPECIASLLTNESEEKK